ncbi:hypothetical protein HYT02_03765 [Candidatus Gottesmanbacteria bacterium]|nr:hypothetical protein [Candidatus Gottesmanbacteria bacterium]
MSERKKPYIDAYHFQGDKLPFVDDGLVKNVISTILGQGNGEVIFPQEVSAAERRIVLNHLYRHHGSLGSRVVFISGIPLEEGVGTLIQISKKQKK